MKATELRIGNWVKRDVQPNGFQIDSHSFLVCEREPEMYNPIPLTEQWLKDFGFKKQKIDGNARMPLLSNCYRWNIADCRESNSFAEFLLVSFEIWQVRENILRKKSKTNKVKLYFYLGECRERIELKYVHQLQNLYFALTEKEIEKAKS